MKKILLMLIGVTLLSTALIGCGDKSGNGDSNKPEVSLENIFADVKETLGEDYYPDRDIDADELEAVYGVEMDDVEEFIAQSPMISVNIDTFIAIKAKDGESDDVKEDLDGYQEYLLDNSLMYPMNLAKVEASEVVQHGDYVFFIMLGAYDDRDDATDEERLTFAKAEVSKVKESINKYFK